MGDNIYLGARDGVRTPMKLSPDRNAGFAKSYPAKLYLPTIMDPVYGYAGGNVEAQQHDQSSFLHWVRRMLEIRREFPGFGTGSFDDQHAENPMVVADQRCSRDEYDITVLCVHHLPRFRPPLELIPGQPAGTIPIARTGRHRLSAIRERPS